METKEKGNGPLYMEPKNWCPVCASTVHEDFDYCPKHEGVLLLQVFSYEPGKVTIPVPGQYDIEHDDFGLDEGLDHDIIDGAGGLTFTQLGKLMGSATPIPNPLIAEWKRRNPP